VERVWRGEGVGEEVDIVGGGALGGEGCGGRNG